MTQKSTKYDALTTFDLDTFQMDRVSLEVSRAADGTITAATPGIQWGPVQQLKDRLTLWMNPGTSGASAVLYSNGEIELKGFQEGWTGEIRSILYAALNQAAAQIRDLFEGDTSKMIQYVLEQTAAATAGLMLSEKLQFEDLGIKGICPMQSDIMDIMTGWLNVIERVMDRRMQDASDGQTTETYEITLVGAPCWTSKLFRTEYNRRLILVFRGLVDDEIAKHLEKLESTTEASLAHIRKERDRLFPDGYPKNEPKTAKQPGSTTGTPSSADGAPPSHEPELVGATTGAGSTNAADPKGKPSRGKTEKK